MHQRPQKPNFHFPGPIRARTYLTKRWRLSRYRGSKFAELYDLEEDPLEMKNLYADSAYTDVRADLSNDMVMAMIENQETSPHPTDFA